MKVTSVELHPANSSEVALLSFRDPGRSNPYNVKTIIGLDADEIIPRFYGGSGNNKFYNLSLKQRDIVVRIELNPRFNLGESFSDLRDSLYRMISLSRTGLIDLRFMNELEVVASISGFVSKLEAAHFTQTPELQFTIKCDYPMLKAPSPVVVDVQFLDPLLTSIEDLQSTAPHGFKFEMAVTSAIPSFSIGNDGWSFDVVPSGGFLVGDVLHFSSEYKDKHLHIIRGLDTIHIADTITPGSVWPILFPGENNFVCSDPTALTWNAISYFPTYWGV